VDNKPDFKNLSEPEINNHLNFILKEARKSYLEYMERQSNTEKSSLGDRDLLELFLFESIVRYKLHVFMVALGDVELIGYDDFKIIAVKKEENK
jgi:hypothetical protein